MIGPFERGHWMSGRDDNNLSELVVGQRYTVVTRFTDYDGHVHAAGEAWLFLGAVFSRYDDGQSLFVSLDGEREWHIRLQRTAEEQGEILQNLSRYIQPATNV